MRASTAARQLRPAEGGGVGPALVAAGVAGLLGAGAGGLGQPQQHAGHHRERRRLEPEAGASGASE